jgi:hypothetical protein
VSRNLYKNPFTAETAYCYAGSGREMPDARKVSAAAIILLLLVFPLIQTSRAADVNSTAKDKLPAFLSAVIGLDLAKYNITNEGYGSTYPLRYGGNVKEENVALYLASSDGEMHVNGMFVNGFIGGIFLYPPTNSSLTYAQQPSTNALDESRNILQKYKTFAENYGFDTSHIDSALTMLSNVTVTSSSSARLYTFNNMTGFVPSVTAAGNMKQETTQTGVKWIYTDKGVDMPDKCLVIDFGSNELLFADAWNLYTVGCFSVISEDEAAQIAFAAAKNYDLTLIGENDTLIHAKPDWTNVTSTIILNMMPGQIYNKIPEDHFVNPGNATRDPLALYPMWETVFYFSRSIGHTVGIAVGVWGDTKEIAYITPYGYLGGSGENAATPTTPTEPSTTPSETSAESESGENPPLNTYLIGGIAVITIAVVVAAVALKKQRK